MTEQLDPARAGTKLAEAVSVAFAEMAFLDAGPANQGNEELRAGEETQCAAIDIMAPLSCRLELRIPAAIRERVIDALFSDAPERERKKNAEDSILEMLNVITGNFLTAYFGSETELQLSLPRYLFLDEALPGTALIHLRLCAEGIPFEATLYSVRYRY